MGYHFKIFKDKFFINNIHCIILLAVTACICVLPLLIHQKLYAWHDINFHLFQSVQFHKAITSGSLIPKWALDSNNGYGSPNFIFYSPLSYYIVSLFHFIIPSIISSIIAAIWFSFYLSGITMYFVACKVAQRTTGLLCAVLYQIFPFHVIDLYFRGSLGELFAFIWFPLIFYYLLEMISSKWNYGVLAGLAISYACLVLSHLVSAFLVANLMLTYILFKVIFSKNRVNVLPASTAIFFGIGLSSYYLLPVITEMCFIKIEYILKYHFYDNYLFCLNKIFEYNRVCYAPLDIVLFIELALFTIIAISFYKNRKVNFNSKLFSFAVYIFLFSLFMSTQLSQWLWNINPMMQKTQFPWRWIAYMELALIFMTIIFFTEAKSNYSFSCSGYYRWARYLLSLLVILSIVCIFFNNREINKQEANNLILPKQAGYYEYNKNLPLEYTPVWAIDLEERLKLPPPERVSVLSGNTVARTISWEAEKRLIHFESTSPSVLRVATFYYPGWQADIDGINKTIAIEKGSGAMLIRVMPGKHVLTLRFVDTPLRRTAKFISLFSCLFLCLYIYKTKYRNNRFQEGSLVSSS